MRDWCLILALIFQILFSFKETNKLVSDGLIRLKYFFKVVIALEVFEWGFVLQSNHLINLKGRICLCLKLFYNDCSWKVLKYIFKFGSEINRPISKVKLNYFWTFKLSIEWLLWFSMVGFLVGRCKGKKFVFLSNLSYWGMGESLNGGLQSVVWQFDRRCITLLYPPPLSL